MSNNEETGPSDQDADEMDYEGEQALLGKTLYTKL